jgi:4-hydroxy-tetrahydrodipicolinate reductase
MKIILAGHTGKLGRAAVEAAAKKPEEFSIAAGIDITPPGPASGFPAFLLSGIWDCEAAADAIIDCSHHSAAGVLLEYAEIKKIPIVICPTGHTPEETELIKSCSKKIAGFKSANMSLGANLVAELAKKAAKLLGRDFDIEIIEKHHNQKADAPSGTALMIAGEICSVLGEADRPEYVYGRSGIKGARKPDEIGIHAIRGGTIVGEHEVIFAGQNVVVSISHSAQSREMFANGALAAARFLRGKTPGLYTMKDLINEITE